mgnify:CR=1 FL=1
MYALLSFIISMTLYVLISYPIMLFLILEDFCAWFAFNNENLAKIYFYFSPITLPILFLYLVYKGILDIKWKK